MFSPFGNIPNRLIQTPFVNALSGVSYEKQSLREIKDKYQLIQDCLDGESAVKYARARYLPVPNPEDESNDNSLRYDSYLKRAVFYAASARTLRGLVGQIFLRDPVFTIPDIMQPIVDNANGEGVDLIQLCKRVCYYALGFGRCGLLVDYPSVDSSTSISQQLNGEVRPIIRAFAPWDVINWKTRMIGSIKALSLVVIRETVDEDNDDFEESIITRYRVLRLVGDDCITQIWEQMKDGNFQITEEYNLCDHTGDLMHSIPFKFIGSENNDADIDYPPMYDLATLNIAHYRNSADYEESCFISGQPTLWMSGLTQEWWEDVLKKKIMMGSRAAIPLPENGSADLLQSLPNTMPFEAMGHKERQMVALGAKLIEPRTIERTATETEIETASDNSVLATAAKNVTSSILWALGVCSEFIGNVGAEIKFELNTNFDLTSMSSEELRQVIAAWQAQSISYSEMRENLKRSGIAKLDDDEAIEEMRSTKDIFVFDKGVTLFERPIPEPVNTQPVVGETNDSPE